MKSLKKNGEFVISSVSKNFDKDSRIYQMMHPHGIESLAVVPLAVNGTVFGFFGIDNPRRNVDHTLLLSVIAFVYCSEITNKRLESSNKVLTGLLKTEKKNTSIISSLSSIFFALYYVDIEEGSIQEIFSPDGVSHIYGEKDNAVLRLKTIVDYWVDDEYKATMRVFTEISTIDKRLGDSSVLTQEYFSTANEWVRCDLIPVEKNKSGNHTKVLYGFCRISAEKERLASQDNMIQALSMSYENVYAVNMDTSQSVCYRMGKIITDRYGEKFAVGNYEDNIRLYVENDVFEDDRYLFDKIRSVSDIKRLLSDRQTYSFSYRVYRNDVVQYFECQVVKPNSKRNEFAMGFKNIDNEKKQELAQQKKIEDALAEVKKINKTLQYEMDIAGVLSKDYPNVVLLNFVDDTVVTIKRNGTIINENERTAKYSYVEIWDRIINNYIPDEDKEKIRDVSSVSTVKQALENSDEYVFNCRIIYDETGIHYYQMSYLRIYSGQEKKSQIILGFRNIDSIIEEERKNIKIMETQSEIIEGLSSVYYSVLLVDPKTDKVKIYRAKRQVGKNCWYERAYCQAT